MIRHHGYPTPLLDWTLSPFIAAYFAFKGAGRFSAKPNRHIRIFVFDGRLWNQTFQRAPAMNPVIRHFTLLEPLGFDNPRMIPQQALSSVTNIDDIEEYILSQQTRSNMTFLRVVDLPTLDRPQAMHELATMGIKAGSLFPGLDGACEQVKERFFDV